MRKPDAKVSVLLILGTCSRYGDECFGNALASERLRLAQISTLVLNQTVTTHPGRKPRAGELWARTREFREY